MGFFESDSEKAQREHNEAQKEGFEADFMDRALGAAVSGLNSDARNAGLAHGASQTTDFWNGGNGKK